MNLLTSSNYTTGYVNLTHKMSPEEQRQAIDRIRRSLGGVKPKTLVVEDNDDDAMVTIRALRKFGVEADLAQTTREAVQAVESGAYKVVFLDLDLKSGDPEEKVLKACKDRRVCQIIVLTGAYSPDSPRCKDALVAGALAIMLKPLTLEQVELIYGVP